MSPATDGQEAIAGAEMSDRVKHVRAEPWAASLIESMRDVGYSLETALADVIDNSITAKATKIQLFGEAADGHPRIGILDNGIGMSESDLYAAMRPGSKSPLDGRQLDDLGRFGLGLKTASFSQCRRLTVVSRRDSETSVAIWDLDYVAEKNDWVLLVPNDLDGIPWADQIEHQGTLVVWERPDRVVDLKEKDGGVAEFTERLDKACDHLSLVFHMFLAGSPGKAGLKIDLNGRKIEAIDPFNSRHTATIHGPKETIRIGEHSVEVQPYTLPHHRKVSKAEWERTGGRGGYLRNQGFYLYRGRRLIIYGTWFGLAKKSPLTNLARVRIDIPTTMDAVWKIDVKKASAQPPLPVRKRLRKIIEQIGATSRRVYTARGNKMVSGSQIPVWNRLQNKNEISYRINSLHPAIVDLSGKLAEDESTDLNRLLGLLDSTIPMDAILTDLGGRPADISEFPISKDDLEYAVAATVRQLAQAGLDLNQIEEMMILAEPFRAKWKKSQRLIRSAHRGMANE